MARPGVTSRTSRWAFLCDEVNFPLIVDAFRKEYIPAAFSPLHDLDVWERPDLLNYCESWSFRRESSYFAYDECFKADSAFTFSDLLKRRDMPSYVFWFPPCAKDTDKERYQFSDEYGAFYAELPKLGDRKKPHYHCQVHLTDSVTRSAFLAKVGLDDGQMYYWEPVGNPAGLLRYYAHMDNPEKAQYNKNDVLSINGFDLSPLYRKTEAAKVAEFEYLYAVVASCPARFSNLATVSSALIESGHPEIAYALRSNSGYWREVIYQLSRSATFQDMPKPNTKRTDYETPDVQISEEQRKADEKHFDEWRASLAAVTNCLVS